MHALNAATGRWPSPGKLCLRLLLVGGIVLAVTSLFDRQLAAPLVPIIVSLLTRIGTDFSILDVQLVTTDIGDVLRIKADLARMVVVNQKIVHPISMQGGGWMEVTLTVGSLLQYPALLLILLTAWPASFRELTVRLLLALPASLLLLTMHVPFTVLAELWFPIFDSVAPGETLPLMVWSRFLMSGGGLVLTLLCAAIVIRCAAALAHRLSSASLLPALFRLRAPSP